MRPVFAILFPLLLSFSCAGARFYSDPDMTRESGVPVYAAKPYLLVSRSGSTTKPVEVAIVYLPDTTRPRFLRLQRGLGGSALSVSLANGVLTALNHSRDGKLPETLSALADLVGAGAALRNLGEAPRAATEPGLPVFELYEIRMNENETTLVPVEIRPAPGSK